MKRHRPVRYVYFARSGDAIKIGVSRRPEARMQQIALEIGQRPEIIGLIYGSFETEKLIHKYLAGFCDGGEWFRDCADVRCLIKYLVAKGPYFQGLPMQGAQLRQGRPTSSGSPQIVETPAADRPARP